MMTYDERIALVWTDGVTLNGNPAKISGARHQFALVTDLRTGLSAQWAWETVARIVAKGGRFTS